MAAVDERVNEPLTEDNLIAIERRARWLSTSDSKSARREDGEAMLRMVDEIRAWRDSQSYAMPSLRTAAQVGEVLGPRELAEIEAHMADPNPELSVILQDLYRLHAEVKSLQKNEVALIRSALLVIADERQLSFDDLSPT